MSAIQRHPSVSSYHKPSVAHVEHATPVSSKHVRDIIPKQFAEFYDASDMAEVTELGRPKFTTRQLVDWQKNDLRSLLILPAKKKSWTSVPAVIEPGYCVLILPYDATREEAIETLASSNLYEEYQIELDVRTEMAKCAVDSVRGDRSDPRQWRHMIETYLLNIGVEVQARLNYKRIVRQLKDTKRSLGESTAIAEHQRKAIFAQVQNNLYKALGLDWEADSIEA